MPEFGPHVSYSDPRIYGLVSGYAWGPHQREMLLGTRPWPQTQSAASIVSCLRERGILVGRDGDGVARIHLPGLPDGDAMLPTVLAHWGILIPRVTVLSLCGPVEVIGGVPLFQGTVFGRTERADGVRRDGLNAYAWIVGRQDVRRTFRRFDDVAPWWEHPGPAILEGKAVRGTLRRAMNTAAAVASYITDWEEYLAWVARTEAEAAEAARREAEALEPVDEQLANVEF